MKKPERYAVYILVVWVAKKHQNSFSKIKKKKEKSGEHQRVAKAISILAVPSWRPYLHWERLV